ncbi:MAG: thiamine ABC transporter substrate-binding protein [Treponemataceae bacterium]|nr:thiamine ABC transporter substrate-binding protein [Treponemataceae bacterium]
MKARLLTFFLLFSIVSLVFAAGSREAKKNAASNEVVIYAHDSFASEWGAGPALCEAFEKKTGIKVNMISVGDAVQVLSRAMLEKDAPEADVLIGLDNNLYSKAKAADILEAYKPLDGEKYIDDELLMEGGWLLVPYDWSSFAMIFDSESGLEAPTCLDDLTKDIYNKKIILMDPRTSTPGLGFAAWTLAVYGLDGVADYWRNLKANILTMAPGWSTGYGLFTEGEAPLVISYTTSPAYHVAYDEGDKFVALEFTDGHTYQTEGAGLMKNAPNKENAKKFLDFLISTDAQEIVPETQWMYPANNSVELPDSFKVVSAVPSKVLTVDQDELDKAVEIILAVLAEN